MISFEHKGSFKNLEKFFDKMLKQDLFSSLHRYAEIGVTALELNTPKDSGVTAGSWGYDVIVESDTVSIQWTNAESAGGVPIVILLQYGHGTGTGGYVAGRDFINPALKAVFDEIARDVWKAVTSA